MTAEEELFKSGKTERYIEKAKEKDNGMEGAPTTVNFNNLLKEEMLWLYQHRCKAHNRRYTEHPSCFLKECKGVFHEEEKIGFLDIETTNLDADFGYILCWSLKELDGELIHSSVTTKEIREYRFDERLMRDFLQAIKPYNRLVGYYSKNFRFDIPFLRTRALKWNLEFPQYRDVFFTDAFDLVKPKLKLHRNRLEVACDLLNIPSKGHRLNPEVWQRAQAGSKDALDYIQTHCDEDVLSLEAVFKRLQGFVKLSKVSL